MFELPLLKKTSSLFGKLSDEHVFLIGIQHLAFTTLELIKELISKGLRSNKIFLLGKCYSANPLVIKELKKIGVKVSEYSQEFDSHLPYDLTFKTNIKRFIKESLMHLPRKEKCKVVLLDDGGSLLNLSIKYFPNHYKIVGIEQTSSGFHLAKGISKHFPIVNVARSNLKLNFESRFISRMVSRKILDFLQAQKKKTETILVLGSGYIGKAVASKLKEQYAVYIYDSRTNLKNTNQQPLEFLLEKTDVVVGCTGFNSIPLSKHRYLRTGSVLISASSSDREFNAFELRKRIPKYSNCHLSPTIDGHVLVNSGFPINFDENYKDSYEFQLTRSLLLAAVYQAVECFDVKRKGFLTLWHQNDIKNMYKHIINQADLLNLRSPEEFDNRDIDRLKALRKLRAS